MDQPGFYSPASYSLKKTVSCPDLREGQSEPSLSPHVRLRVLNTLHSKETQISFNNLQVHETGAQYSAPTENSETDYISEEESLPDEIPCDNRKTELKSSEIPQDRNRTSTPIPQNQVPRAAIEEIIHHPPAFQVPPVDIVVAPDQ